MAAEGRDMMQSVVLGMKHEHEIALRALKEEVEKAKGDLERELEKKFEKEKVKLVGQVVRKVNKIVRSKINLEEDLVLESELIQAPVQEDTLSVELTTGAANLLLSDEEVNDILRDFNLDEAESAFRNGDFLGEANLSDDCFEDNMEDAFKLEEDVFGVGTNNEVDEQKIGGCEVPSPSCVHIEESFRSQKLFLDQSSPEACKMEANENTIQEESSDQGMLAKDRLKPVLKTETERKFAFQDLKLELKPGPFPPRVKDVLNTKDRQCFVLLENIARSHNTLPRLCKLKLSAKTYEALNISQKETRHSSYDTPLLRSRKQRRIFPGYTKMRKRRTKISTSSGSAAFTCQKCRTVYTSMLGLKYHMELHHLKCEESTLKCKGCGKSFPGYFHMYNHYYYFHRSLLKKSKRELLRCRLCRKEKNVPANRACWNHHFQRMHNGKSLECQPCGLLYKSAWCFNRHLNYFH